MSVFDIGNRFPTQWLWGAYEHRYIDCIKQQIQTCYPKDQSLLINLTWFSPYVDDDFTSKQYRDLFDGTVEFTKIFMLATVDPYPQNIEQIERELLDRFPSATIYRMGNAQGKYYFNFFAPVLLDNFKHYNIDDLILREIRWVFISYNRKPHAHRSDMVMKLLNAGLDAHGIVTLGKAQEIWDDDPKHRLYLTQGERSEDYVSSGHWLPLNEPDPYGIPHDVLSLHRMEFWKHHFLHIVNATQFLNMPEIFVSETQFKPIIGMRPFVINGNPLTYSWLESNGFRHFNRYWSDIDLTDGSTLHDRMIVLLKRLVDMDRKELISMWHDMLPDLEYNRQRFFEFAREQDLKIKNLFKET